MGVALPVTAETNHGGQIWGGIQVTAPLSDDVFITSEIQPRWSTKNAATAPITVIPPIISWRKSESLILSAGYLYAFIDGARLPQDLHENRFLQQASYRIGAIGRVGVRAQTRFEQRQRSTGKDWNLRVAQQLLLATPLTKKESGGPVGVVSVELYWNLTDADWGARKGYDDLWTFAGVRTPISEAAALELGYLNQRQRAVNGRANMNHAAVIGISFQLSTKIVPPKVVPTTGPGLQPLPDRERVR
ncbi:DUF2490 domain-containing protein [Sphingomonas olei]|uniref:DUF2490 domain-containing protein n=1 Tax=Sphingomonas olei TaxID=1886787 RepID=A0ABY2QDK5_9SPHN|nr:DUF2490 domain-containing protein [Sphingomonas olei]THG37796.1 DUF2490 domain-containing protein [Sphingomonas olei]